MWNLWLSNRFKRGYKGLDKPIKEKVSQALETLVNSSSPGDLGDLKTGPWRGYYTYNISYQCRILYDPIKKINLIRFHRVCSHKAVYGP